MSAHDPKSAAGLAWVGCETPLGDAEATARRLRAGEVALRPHPALGVFGGDEVPLALFGPMVDELPPRWGKPIDALLEDLPEGPWGSASHPIVVTSSNFSVGHILAMRKLNAPNHAVLGSPQLSVEWIAARRGWGPHITVLSHACVSAQLGMVLGARLLHDALVERVLVFTFDFLSAFVAGGFSALKILNGQFPAPFAEHETGAIGLGEAVAGAILTREDTPWRIESQELHNEMYHMTANDPSGAGFDAVLEPLASFARGRRLWIKGHGTGTLDAGRLESARVRAHFGEAPLISWKGSLGHTLGSCGLVELAVALAATEQGEIPGTVGTGEPVMSPSVACTPFAAEAYEGFVLLSNAFGGAQAASLVTHA